MKVNSPLIRLSDDQIERCVERAINKLDARLLDNKLSQLDYDREVSLIDKWAQRQYDAKR